jgi:protein-L-isoaspartate(D-aspartate) O-methyltransferase
MAHKLDCLRNNERRLSVNPDPIDIKAIEAASFVMALRARGVRDVDVLRAMELIPREIFAPPRFRDLARTDVSLPLACGQTMTAPATVAVMLVALDVQRSHRVFEIGTGSGYVSALLAQLAGAVHSMERFASLASSATERFRLMGLAKAVTLTTGDGLAPPFARARFDRILINGSLPAIPALLSSMLAPHGCLVGILQQESMTRLTIIKRSETGELQQENGLILRMPPLAQGVAEAL